jgi:hypothetical protein
MNIQSEVRVDRLNEKGVFVAEQILNILHNTLPPVGHAKLFAAPTQIPFSFEVMSIAGVLRFFISAPEEYISIFENQIYAHFPNVEISRVTGLNIPETLEVAQYELTKSYIYPIKIYTNLKDRSEKETVDPLSSITSAISKAKKEEFAAFQVVFSPVYDADWKSEKRVSILTSKRPKWLKEILLSSWGWLIAISMYPLRGLYLLGKLVAGSSDESTSENRSSHAPESDAAKLILEKITPFGYAVSLRSAASAASPERMKALLAETTASLSILGRPDGNTLVRSRSLATPAEFLARSLPKKSKMILNTAELAGMVHMPTIYVSTPGINWVTTKKFEPPANLPVLSEDYLLSPASSEITPIGTTNFRGTDIPFWILPWDRRRHAYIIGKTGMGKSTLLENMIFDDICKGRGVAIVDPHGDLAETILSCIPKNRTNDVILFDPSDAKWPIAFNMLEQVTEELRPIVASGLVGVFKKIFGESWGPRLEYILRNTILTLLEVPETTIMSIPLMLTMKSYRQKITSKVKDPILKKFWETEFEAMGTSGQTEASGPILNKVGQFLSSPLVRNIVGQPKNPFSLRWAMDNKKIVIVNLSKGKIGEDSSALLGALMITKFQIDAMSRADIPEKDRVDFYLYVDEFQNFATDSFATILSEARKYKLNLVMANQYIEQMSETVRGAVFGNVGTTLSFQVGSTDARVLAEALDEETVLPLDLMNLRKYDIYTKLLIDGMPSAVFSATTFAPIQLRIEIPEQKRDIIAKVSREKYAKPVDMVEKKIMDFNIRIVEEEKKFKHAEEAYKEKKKEEKRAKSAELTKA